MVRKIIRPEAVSEKTGIALGTLAYWRHRDEGPKSFKLGRRVAYFEDDVDAWIESQYAAATKEPA